MDINLLVLNIGNSRLAIGVFIAGELKYVNRSQLSQTADWPGKIREAWKMLSAAEAPAVAAASVNPSVETELERVVQDQTRQSIQWVGRRIDLPIKVLTDNPTETGVDRILAVAAAYEQMEKACIVVDAGTALTVNCCNDAGEFLGGAIAPGAALQLKALHEYTARLPAVEMAAPAGFIGMDTRDAMLCGVYHGIRGLVKELAEGFASELGQWPEIIATGGDAAVLFEGWELIHAISPDLTLYGIALAYAEHLISHQE